MVNQKIYVIDFDKLVKWLTPNRIVVSRIDAWLKVLAAPVVFLYQEFLRFRKVRLYELSITPQVASLERLLNDRWDPLLRRIYIDDAIIYAPLYLYRDAESHEISLYTVPENQPVTVYTDGETLGSTADDFIIMVPIDVVFNTTEMRSLVNVYKLAGMKFKIQTF